MFYFIYVQNLGGDRRENEKNAKTYEKENTTKRAFVVSLVKKADTRKTSIEIVRL